MEASSGLSKLRVPLVLPPKSTAEAECFSHSEGLGRHQRTYSDSMLTEEVPCWLQELLDEPETPLCRSHRRSSSDSTAYLQMQKTSEKETKLTATRSNTCSVTLPSSVTPQEAHAPKIDIIEKQDVADLESSSVQHHCSYSNPSASRAYPKHVKRHSAQHNRAKKVQYITELERTVQALQAEGYEAAAELEFLDQQNLILGMENRALKQRLDGLSQEQFIKCLEQEMLEKEIARLRNLYQQQQHKQQQKHYSRPRSKSQDLDSSFANKGTELQKAK